PAGACGEKRPVVQWAAGPTVEDALRGVAVRLAEHAGDDVPEAFDEVDAVHGAIGEEPGRGSVRAGRAPRREAKKTSARRQADCSGSGSRGRGAACGAGGGRGGARSRSG